MRKTKQTFYFKQNYVFKLISSIVYMFAKCLYLYLVVLFKFNLIYFHKSSDIYEHYIREINCANILQKTFSLTNS